MTANVYLSLGSNSGDRHAMIGKAVAALSSAFDRYGAVVRVAEPVTSMPQGFVSDKPFVNVGLTVSFEMSQPWTDEGLHGLLDITQAIERSLSAMPHRNPDGSYRDREIDIDIIAVDAICFCSPRLTLPHPAMSERRFVLLPMSQLLPDWRHPQSGLTPAEMMERL